MVLSPHLHLYFAYGCSMSSKYSPEPSCSASIKSHVLAHNHFPASQDFFHLCMFLLQTYIDSNQTAPFGSSLIMVNCIFSHDRNLLEVHLEYMQQMYKSTFSEQKKNGGTIMIDPRVCLCLSSHQQLRS